MNFDCVGRKENGEMYMKFRTPFNPTEKIQLLQRSILVNSFAYYELDSNILTDYQYDANARQLEDLAKTYPEEFKCSRYYEYFHDFYDADEHATSGFDLLEKVKKQDAQLYRYIWMDAVNALEQKKKRGVAE